jgi:glycosyltransferase involved in cell wall biosynthesis
MTSSQKPFTLTVVLSGRAQTGGGYHQALTSLEGILKNLPPHYRVKVLDEKGTFTQGLNRLVDAGLLKHTCIDTVPRRLPTFRDRVVTESGVLYRFVRWLLTFRGFDAPSSVLARYLDTSDTDLVYFATPTMGAHELHIKPFIWTLWDLCHLDSPEFPEVRTSGKFEAREKSISQNVRKAALVVVDSKTLESNARLSYGITADKFVTIPFSPPQSVMQNTTAESELPSPIRDITGRYVFYPAQLWTHKNHLRIAQALSILIKKGHDIHAVFIGKDHGAGARLRENIAALGVADRVHFLGYVDDQVVPELYRHSLGLVMASYFGPTNIPPLEALQLDVPVIASLQHKEQLGNAALYFDPDNAEELADRILELGDSAVVKKLRANGNKLLASLEVTQSEGYADLSARIEALEKRLLR